MANFPQRPPRKVLTKSEQRTVGLLLSVVRTLTTSGSQEQREFEKQRLEHGYAETSKALQLLLGGHQDDLTKCLQAFRKISSSVITARERIRNVKNSLALSKALLACKRDDLRKLCTECAEQRHVLRLLQEVEFLKQSPMEFQEAVGAGHYLRASQIVLKSASSISKDFEAVEGLRELNTDLHRRREELLRLLLDELHRIFYTLPSEAIIFEYRTQFSRNDSVKVTEPSAADHTRLLEAYAQLNEDDFPILTDNGFAYEDESAPRADAIGMPVQTLAVIAEALAVLEKVPEAVQSVRKDVLTGLQDVVQKCAVFVVESKPLGRLHTHSDAHRLGDYLQLLFRVFRVVAMLHGVFVNQLRRVHENSAKSVHDEVTYNAADVWNAIQHTLKMQMDFYLDSQGTGSSAALSPAFQASANLTSYFAKRRPARPKRPALFRFVLTGSAAHSRHAHTPDMASLAITAPNPEHIVDVFRPMMKFAAEIERKLRLNTPCPLRLFLEDYVRATYLVKVTSDVDQKVLNILESGDSWTALTGPDEMKRLSVSVPILMSAARLTDLCTHVTGVIANVPTFAEQLCLLLVAVLKQYHLTAREVVDRLTRSIKQDPHVGGVEVELRKISSTWAVDEDISRLLKSLPNWIIMMEGRPNLVPGSLLSPPVLPTPSAESAHDVLSRNQRESEILMGNLGMQKKIDESEVIQDPGQLKLLANMNESLELFVSTVQRLVHEKQLLEPGTDAWRKFSEDLEVHLLALDDMAATCLLILHLEVRMHCFFYLLPITRHPAHMLGSLQAQEVDPQVLSLNRSLVQLHELLRGNLHVRKVRYIFEGLGYLIASIFVNSAQYITKINDNGKKRMCRNIFAIQQCLSGMTGTRESDLDQARRYFELLYKSAEEILNELLERGPEFTQLEYSNLLGLAVRSNPTYSTEPGTLDKALKTLQTILAQREQKGNYK